MVGSNYFYQNSLERIFILCSAMPLQYCMNLQCTGLLGMSAIYSGWYLAQKWLDMPILCGTDRIFLRLRKLKCSFYKSQPLHSYLSCFLPWAGIQAMPLVTYYYISFCCILLLCLGICAWSVFFRLFLQDTFSFQTTLYVSRTQRRYCNIHSFFFYCFMSAFHSYWHYFPSKWKGNFYLISFHFWMLIRFLWFTLNKYEG